MQASNVLPELLTREGTLPICVVKGLLERAPDPTRRCYHGKKTAAGLRIKPTLPFKEAPRNLAPSPDVRHGHSLPLCCDPGARPHMDLELHGGAVSGKC